MDDPEVSVQQVKSLEERNREGWANAIVISSSDEDEEHGAAAARPRPPVARGKRPLLAQPVATDDKPDIKPDLKRMRADASPAPPPPLPPYAVPAVPGAMQPATDLAEDLSFAAPRGSTFGPHARRAGHIMVKLSAAAEQPGDVAHVRIGTGRESSAHDRLQQTAYIVREDDGASGELLAALRRLANPANTRTARNRVGVPLVGVEWQPKMPWRLRRGEPPVEVRLDVWLQPEIFELRISTWHSASSCFYDIWTLMDKIVPAAPFVETPRPPPVQGDAVLAPCGAANAPDRAALPAPSAHSFTLAGLMRAMESAGYEEMVQPPGLELTLYPFQRQSLQWMHDRETQPGGLNALFWREHPSDDGRRFFYNPMAGELRAEPLPVVTGGFLCEEMGLGKTVEMCALILANPYTAAASAEGRQMIASPRRVAAKATLIVVPVVLLGQWQAEIKKCAGSRLAVSVYHGAAATKKESHKDLSPLLSADVVLTTYEVLRQEAPFKHIDRVLLRIHWWRVVLDESQRVPKPAGAASAMTQIARACKDLSRTHSWCMSGTPVGSVVDDLLGQLIFLGVEPYCSRGDNGDAFWEREVSGRWKARDADALEVVHDLLGQIMMRHSKAQTMSGPGGQRTALVPLPDKTEVLELVHLADPSERAVYGELERICREDVAVAEAARAELARAQAAGASRARIEALRQVVLTHRKEDLLTPRELQLAATHVSSLNLDGTSGLEKKLAARATRAPLPRGIDLASAPSGALGGAVLLRELLASGSHANAARLKALLDDANAQRCGLCSSKFGAGAFAAGPSSSSSAEAAPVGSGRSPRLTACGHLFCTACLKSAAHQRAADACPECDAEGVLVSATQLHTPLGARSLDEVDEPSSAGEPRLPPVETAAWQTHCPPCADRLAGLKVWRCSGAPCHDSSARQVASAEKVERSVTIDVDSMHFCSQLCAEEKLKRVLEPYCTVCQQPGHQRQDTYWTDPVPATENRRAQPSREAFYHPRPGGAQYVDRDASQRVRNPPPGDTYCIVGHGWPGRSMQDRVFAKVSEAVQALKGMIRADPSYRGGSKWEGEAVYEKLVSHTAAASASSSECPAELCRRPSVAQPHLSRFPPGAPEGSFIAHLDAAGAPRSYGKHWPYHLGTKVQAALAHVERVRQSSGNGSRSGAASDKVVVFSDSKDVLEVMHEAARRARGDAACALITGATGFEERMKALAKFKESAACYMLLLAVGACASGLTLTAANHCILLDLQAHEGKELQLINRVWRIGQSKPVTITRFVTSGTVEERMLHLRKRSRGLMATDETDVMTVLRVEDEAAPASDGAASEVRTERAEDLRYLYGLGE